MHDIQFYIKYIEDILINIFSDDGRRYTGDLEDSL